MYNCNIHVKADQATEVELLSSKHLTAKFAIFALIVKDFQPTSCMQSKRGTWCTSATHRDSEVTRGGQGFLESNIVERTERRHNLHPTTRFPRIRWWYKITSSSHASSWIWHYLRLLKNTYLQAKYEPDRKVAQVVVSMSLVPTIIRRQLSDPQASHLDKERYLHQARL